MNFPFVAEKLTEVAAIFVDKCGREVEVLKLVKLLYLAERKSFERRGGPIFGGSYFSLPHGPITSEGLDLINGRGDEVDQAYWDEAITRRNGNDLQLKRDPRTAKVSAAERLILDEIFSEHGGRTAGELRNWCHRNLPEYEEVEQGRRPITTKELGLAVDSDPASIAEEAAARQFLQNVFAS